MTKLREHTIQGFIWTFIGSVGSGALNFIVLLILARLLNPSDFGLLELIVVVTSISSVIVDSGFSQALIRDLNSNDKDFASVFYFNITIALVLYCIAFFFASYFASFFNAEELTAACQFGFLAIIFESIGVVPIAIFSQKMQFKSIAMANIIGIIIAGFVGITLAFNGLGIWSLTSTIVLLPFVRSVILLKLSHWHPQCIFSFTPIRRYFKFSSFLLLHGLVDKFVINFESLAIGKFYTKYELAYFSQSRKLDAYFSQTLTNVIQKVTYPALCKLSDTSERLKAGYRQIIGLSTFVIFPIMIFLIFFPENFMSVLFGKQWIEAAPMLRLWCLFGLVYPMQSISNNIFYVKGYSKSLFKISMLRQISKVVIVIILVPISIMSVLQGVVIIAVFFTFVYIYRSGKLINYSLREVFIDIYINLLSAGCAALIILLIFSFTPDINLYVSFGLKVLLMLLLYLGINKAVKNKSFVLFLNIISGLINKFYTEKRC